MHKEVNTACEEVDIYLKYATTLTVKSEKGKFIYRVIVPAGTEIHEYGWITDEDGMVKVTLPLQGGALFTGLIHESLVHVKMV